MASWTTPSSCTSGTHAAGRFPRDLNPELLHRAFYARTSDWLENSFIIVVYENFFSYALDRKFWLNLKIILIDNHFKTILESVRSVCPSTWCVRSGGSRISPKRGWEGQQYIVYTLPWRKTHQIEEKNNMEGAPKVPIDPPIVINSKKAAWFLLQMSH